MKQDDLLKYLLIGVGAYLVWQYVIQPMMAQQTATGTGTGTGTGVTQQQPIVVQSPVQTGTQTGASAPQSGAVTAAQLQKLAGVVLLNPDQWAYYYHTIPGKANLITGSQMEQILANLSLTDATRATNITATQFVNALNSIGLSGIVPSWTASGGPAFNNFIPGGMSFSGGFSGVNRGFRAAPGKYIQ